MDIKKDPIYKEFILNRNLKPATIHSYTRKLQIYCEIAGLNPTQLIEQAEEDEDNGIRLRKRRIKTHLLNYQEYLIHKDFSPRKIVDNISTIRGFYNYYEIQIPNRIYSNNNPDLTPSEIPSKEDIQLALSNNSSQRFATLIIFMCTSGIAIGDVLNLKYTDFLKSLKIPPNDFNKMLDIELLSNSWDENTIQEWYVKRQKTGTLHYTFNTPEATKYLFMYLEQNPPEDPEDFLFRGNTGKKMREDVFQRFLRRLNKKCGWAKNTRQIFIHSHVFRKYFSNTLEESGMPHYYIRQILGHRKDPLTRAYFTTPLEKLREGYFKYMPHLYFFEEIEVRVVTDEKLEEMEKKIDEMNKAKKLIDDILNNPTVLEKLNSE